MLQIDKVQLIDDVTVYSDDKNDHTFYLLPQTPRFRLEGGMPVFKFVKYRQVRKDGKDIFGGICAFDTEFVVDPEKLPGVIAKLQAEVDKKYQARGQQPPQVKHGTLTYTSGTATLNIGEGSVLVQKVRGAGKPSLYGNNVATFWVELTEMGAQVFEKALQGQGGFVSVVYDMKIFAKLPPITARAWWHATSFYSFVQDINTEDNFWSEDSYTETIEEQVKKKEWMGVEFNFVGNPTISPDERRKVEDSIRTNITQQLTDAIERNMLEAIQKVDPDTKSLREEQDIEDVKKTITKSQASDVNIHYKEQQVVEWNIVPQGLLPNITTMKNKEGKTFQWKDFAVEVDGNDPFFQTLEVSVRVNADFAQLPIFNVETKLTYPSSNTPVVEEFTFQKPDDVGKFRAALANNTRKYKYVYQVNYKGDNRTFTSPELETDDTQLTINVDDLGILMLDIAPGDINFTQVKQAQVKVRYEDAGIDPVERQFTMTAEKNTFSIREVIFKPRNKPIKYDVKYFMADGREFEVKGKQQDGPQLYINDPFTVMKTVGLRAVGDLNARIQSIMVDLAYREPANNYAQTKTIALSKATPFHDWTFPVIDENAGEVKYSYTVQYADGTTREVPETKATKTTIPVGDIISDRLEVTVVPDLIDFSLVRLVKVTLKHSQDDVVKSDDFIFKKGDTAKNWVIELKDKSKRDFTWSADFFMTTGPTKKLVDQKGDGETVILEVPA